MKICIVYSNRSEYAILSPYIDYLKTKCVTNVINLAKNIKQIENDEKLSNVYSLLFKKFSKTKFDYIIVLGDRRELPFIALAALFLEIKLIHIGAGEYLKGLPTYDQIIRPFISIISNYQICFSKNAEKEVKKLFSGISNLNSNVHNYGNPVFRGINIKKLKRLIKEKFDLVLLHPQSLSKKETMKDVETIKKCITKKNTVFIKGNKDRNYEIIENFYNKLLLEEKSYKFYQSLSKEKYFSLVKYCDKFYTNTSSISEIEFLNKECLVTIGNRNKDRSRHELNNNAPKLLYNLLKKELNQ